jgi:SOS-response transcriptional repressor LexA
MICRIKLGGRILAMGDVVLKDYALQPRDGDIVAALVDGFENTLKVNKDRVANYASY